MNSCILSAIVFLVMLLCFCSAIQCGRIENGKIVNEVEEKTTFQCNHGYKSENGINETTCTSEGWSPVPTCTGKKAFI